MSRNKKIVIVAGAIITVAIGITVFAYQRQFGAPQRTAEEERVVINLTTAESELIPDRKSVV